LFQSRPRHAAEPGGHTAAEDRKRVRLGRTREIAESTVDDDAHDGGLRPRAGKLRQVLGRGRDEERQRDATVHVRLLAPAALGADPDDHGWKYEIGRASCRERVESTGGAV